MYDEVVHCEGVQGRPFMDLQDSEISAHQI